jgi:hypothetical protein
MAVRASKLNAIHVAFRMQRLFGGLIEPKALSEGAAKTRRSWIRGSRKNWRFVRKAGARTTRASFSGETSFPGDNPRYTLVYKTMMEQ